MTSGQQRGSPLSSLSPLSLPPRCPEMTLHLGRADAAFVVLSSGCVKVIHPAGLAADEGCLIDQGPIYRRRAGRANEERDLPALFSLGRQENAVMPGGTGVMSGAAAGDKSLPFSSVVLYEAHASAERTSRFMCRVQRKVLLESCLDGERLTVMLMVTVALLAACYPLRTYIPVIPGL